MNKYAKMLLLIPIGLVALAMLLPECVMPKHCDDQMEDLYEELGLGG